jgi:arginine/serine-rich splicing factor 7
MGRYSRSRSASRSRSRDRGRNHFDGYDSEQGGYRVHVADLGIDCTQKDIEKNFNKFGEIKDIWLARNPPCFAFLVYKHRSEAEDAIREMDGR